MKYLILVILLFSHNAFSQLAPQDIIDIDNEDLTIGGDIFSDYNEDVDSVKELEDERFFRYGRFFGVQLSFGSVSYTGNRGRAYDNAPPSAALSVVFFQDFRVAYTLGVGFSRHNMELNGVTKEFNNNGEAPGAIQINMVRPWFGMRYYFDTADLGTAFTYSNPYFTGNLEYWYQKNKFIDSFTEYEDQSGGGIGFSAGMGLEFPIVLREYYLGIELKYHMVNFFDKDTTAYQGIADSVEAYEDLKGNAVSFLISYVINW